jgi:hypothetical protein
MKTVDKGRFGPWEPMQGARGRAEAIQQANSVAPSADKQNRDYRHSVKNPSAVKPAVLKRARGMARRGISAGSTPNGADR